MLEPNAEAIAELTRSLAWVSDAIADGAAMAAKRQLAIAMAMRVRLLDVYLLLALTRPRFCIGSPLLEFRWINNVRRLPSLLMINLLPIHPKRNLNYRQSNLHV